MGKPLTHKARKRFGQNFLHDQNIIERIISSIAATSEQHLVEIGPGKGALTEHLVDAAGKLDVIELDRDLVPLLQTRFSDCRQFTIHNADALQFDFSSLLVDPLHNSLQKSNKLRLVGNLPYNIATPLIFHLLDNIGIIQDMYFMLQKEVVDRLTACPGTRSYGRLSILVQYLCQAELLFIVPPNAFTPIPGVDSAIVQLTPRMAIEENDKLQNTTAAGLAQLSYIAKAAFAQRRKTLRNNLKKILPDEQIIQCDIDPGRRAETLTISEFVALTNQYAQLHVA
ncbi:MAG: 16S rRNA (adenine(1518)-N(6)/adenine(1519)-N(6))-dimethyltransferase RsmA [Gammaproteobacteria bacterium]|nr:16S rRNA (adenine(1518)-N(6)/adenine(1519)-N(6))-dimethyltransferase RsmA [Gammaproteobacteria bacterium]